MAVTAVYLAVMLGHIIAVMTLVTVLTAVVAVTLVVDLKVAVVAVIPGAAVTFKLTIFLRG